MAKDNDRLIGTTEAAEILDRARTTVLWYIKQGRLAYKQRLPGRIGDYLLSLAEVEKLRKELEAEE